MEKVLNITGRIEDRKRHKQIESNRDKFDAVQRMLQCGTCRFKCAMCGRHAEEAKSSSQKKLHSEFSLCESCGAEFEDYIKAETLCVEMLQKVAPKHWPTAKDEFDQETLKISLQKAE